MGLLNPFRTMTPAEMLTKQLAEAERQRVEYQANEEQARFAVSMLQARISRIRGELVQINNTAADAAAPQGE